MLYYRIYDEQQEVRNRKLSRMQLDVLTRFYICRIQLD